MNPPFHFMPALNVPITIPIKTWLPPIFGNRTLCIVIPIKTDDDTLEFCATAEKKDNGNTLALGFYLDFKNRMFKTEEKLNFIYFRVRKIPKSMNLISLKANVPPPNPQDPTYIEIQKIKASIAELKKHHSEIIDNPEDSINNEDLKPIEPKCDSKYSKKLTVYTHFDHRVPHVIFDYNKKGKRLDFVKFKRSLTIIEQFYYFLMSFVFGIIGPTPIAPTPDPAPPADSCTIPPK